MFTEYSRACDDGRVAIGPGVDAPVALALSAGVVAAFNPCGFAMLPAYVSYFVGTNAEERSPLPNRLVRAAVVGLVVTLGFVTVFGLIGLAATGFRSTVNKIVPYVSVIVGIVLVGLGVAMLRGFEPKLGFLNLRARKGNALRSMYMYGLSYAVVSLSCGFPGFAAAVVTGFQSKSFVAGIKVYLAYAVGMGLVLVVLSFAVAVAQHTVVRGMRKVLPYVNRASGVLLVIAGLYVSYYGYYEWRTTIRFEESPAGPVTWVTNWSASISTWVGELSTTALVGLVVGVAGVIAASVALARGSRPPQAPTPTATPTRTPTPGERRRPTPL